jgi:hypothetical protein
MPTLLRARKLTSAEVDGSLVHGSWKRLVFGASAAADGAVDRNAYVFCVLPQFHRYLKWRGDLRLPVIAVARPARAATRRRGVDQREGLGAEGVVAARDPGRPARRARRTLDAAYRTVGERLEANTAVDVDRDGQLHIERLEAIDEPASLIELRRDVNALLPRVDLPEVILEVMSWEPRFVAAFAAASGGQTRLADLHVTIAACLTAHSLNIGYSPIVKKGVPALERDRISHVNQNYLGTETYEPANGWLISAQTGIALAQAWGGGLVAGIDGMRFIVPIPSIYARPNRKYFGSKRGVTWLNMVNDQGSGLAAKVVSGTPGESLHMIDVIFSQDGGQRPDIIVADTGTYSDLVFGLAQLLGIEYRPELADGSAPAERSPTFPTMRSPVSSKASGRAPVSRHGTATARR